ncbi:MAG: hypothetical protein PWP08_689 [Methanofollis sp.]|nr:hypothetical protein [Methanofollis sp.]
MNPERSCRHACIRKKYQGDEGCDGRGGERRSVWICGETTDAPAGGYQQAWKASRMIILHSFWNPAEKNTLFFWGEDTALPQQGTTRRGRRPKKPPVLPHPFAADIPSLTHALSAVGYPTGIAGGPGALLLPVSGQYPLPSPGCGRTPAVTGAVSLAPFAVPLLSCPLSVRALAGVASGPSVGATLEFWSAAARYALYLVIQGSFLPGPFGWEAVTETDEHPGTILEAFPPACSIWAGDGWDGSSLLTAFLNHAVHTIVAGSVSNLTLLPGSRGRPKKTVPPEEEWFRLLTGKAEEAGEAIRRDERFQKKVRAWLDGGRVHTGRAALRGCFRLEEPEPDEDRWFLTFHLVSADDPGVLIPAEEIWKGGRGRAARFRDAGEHLLAELGRAAQIYPALRQGLRTARPTQLALDTEGACAFLNESAPLLIDAGFSVILPKWWKSTGSRASVRVTVSPSAATGRHLGLRSLVSYSWNIAIGDVAITPEEFEELARLKIPLVQMHGRWVSIDEFEIEKAKRAFERRYGTMTVGDLLRISAGADTDLPQAVIVEAESWIRDLIGTDVSLQPVPLPQAFQGTLRPYQEQGLAWLSFLTRRGLGACLADDMGLGKTVQVIAYLLAWRDEAFPALIVCPTSIVGNWRRELARFAPDLTVRVHHGTDRDPAAIGASEVTITTYPLVVRDIEPLRSVSWKTVLLDEAQNIKNPLTRQAKAVRSLTSERRIALTGTPVENRLTELWSIMEFLNPGYLGSIKTFQERYAVPIERYRDPARTEQLRSLIRPFLLRRLKTDRTIITDLPEKMEMKVFCTLTTEQATLYEAVVQEMLDQIEGREGIQRSGLVLSALTQLKQICIHPALFLGDGAPLGNRSGKITRLLEMLEEVLETGEKALIFTQFPSFGERLGECITDRLGVPVLFLHGGTPQRERDAMVQQFQGPDGPPVFLLSLKAGGTGLNLTAANHVFHLDRWWNPAVENQATDRAFRIGQSRDVQVRLMITGGTLEEQIDQIIEEKKVLAGSILSGGEDWITALSDDQLRELLTLRRDGIEEGLE